MKTTSIVLAVSCFAVLFAAAFQSYPRTSPGAEAVAANKSIPDLPRRIVPMESEREGLRARLVLRERGRKDGTDMYSLGIEIENASFSKMALVEFDPMDLKVELLDAGGKTISPSPATESAPWDRDV